MPLAHLSIGTSSNRISLLNPDGFLLDDWQVGGTEYGTIFQESQLADFRQMAAYRDVTTFETFNLKLRGNSQDNAARQIQDMRAIIHLMLDYWTSTYQTSVVYLAARASCETNMRYSVVHDARLVGEGSPFGQPFLQVGDRAIMDVLSLIVERGPWLENAPGTGTGVKIGTTQTYDGRTVGNVDHTGAEVLSTAARTVFAANKHNVAQLTDVWYYDQSAAGWNGANLMDAILPFAFLPPSPSQLGDCVVFGIDTTVGDSGPFSSLVFDLSVVNVAAPGQWRYSSVGVDPQNWNALTVQDNTDQAGAGGGAAFDTLGLGSVHWEQPSDWITVNPTRAAAALGVTGYWVCWYATHAVGQAYNPPQQQNRDIYTVTWPYIDVDADQVEGDMPALLRLAVDSRSAEDGLGTTTDLWVQRTIAGLRSYDRGADFTAYINISDEQVGAGVTINLGGGMGAFAANTLAPTGRTSTYTAAAVDAIDVRVYIQLGTNFYGRYHAFVRGRQATGVVGSVDVRLEYAPGDASIYADKKTVIRQFVNTNDDQLLDFGEIVLGPDSDIAPYDMVAMSVNIEAGCTDGGGATAYFYDLILIPVDEWAIDSEDMFKTSGAANLINAYLTHLNIDAIQNPRKLLSHLIRTPVDRIERYWRPIVNGIPILQSGKHQRLWLLATHGDPYSSTTNLPADSELCHTVQVWRNQRYTTLRGDR